MSSVQFVVECIKERLDAIDLPVSGVQARVSAVLGRLLHESSPDYYGTLVTTECPNVQLDRLRQCDVVDGFEAFHRLWGRLPRAVMLLPELQRSFEEYIACKKTYGPAQQRYAETHVEVTQSLMCLRHRVNETHAHLFMKLLAVTYWLFRYHCKKELDKKHKKTYNVSLHHFLSDLLVTLLLLMCLFQLPLPTQSAIPEFPENFKKTIIHLGISPSHAVFQRLVLKQMLKILGIEIGNLRTPQDLAVLVYWHLGDSWLWSKKGADGILRIVKDQSRYLTLRNPGLRRNFVADKTRRWISRVVKNITEYKILVGLKSKDEQRVLRAEEEQKVLETFRMITTGIDTSDDGIHLPPLPKKLSSDDIRLINLIHHLILFDVCEELLGPDCPRIDHRAWFVLENFVDFVECLARRVVERAKKTPTLWRKGLVYPQVAKIAVSLQQIIAARWYITEVEGKGKIAANDTLKQHQEVVFLFIAFRAVLMYLLPQCPCDVQRVAPTLPKYAEQIKLNLHLHVS